MKKSNCAKHIAIALTMMVMAILITSCQEKEIVDEGSTNANQGSAIVRMSITTPQPTTLNRLSRAVVDPENRISSVWILVFDKEGSEYSYKYKVEGSNIVTDDTQNTTFTALIKTSPQAMKLMLITNADDVMQSVTPSIGMSESGVRTMLNAHYESRLLSDLPMWGEINLPSGITANGTNNLSAVMLRSVARVDVVKDLNPDSFPFELQVAHVVRTNDLFQIAPNIAAMGATQVSTPSVPSGANLNALPMMISSEPGDLITELNQESQVIQTIRKIYIPEAITNPADKIEGVTSVIVGGKYNQDNYTTYYRIDFDSKIAGHPHGQVLRNHKYVFNIRRVWGRGWSTPEEAAKNSSSNVLVSVEQWNDFTNDMYFDSEHYFGLSTRKPIVESIVNSTTEIKVNTDMETYTIEWADATGNGLGGAIKPGNVINNGVFSVAPSADKKSIMVTALLSNAGQASVRTQKLLIKANRFEIPVTIEQEKFSNATRGIKTLSIRSSLGFLGNTDPGINTPAEPRAAGLRGILTNTANFGPTGIVQTAGFVLSDVLEPYANNITDTYLSQYDVVYIPDIAAQAVINPTTAGRIVNWLGASKNRFLVVCFDEINRNKNILDAMGVTGVTWENRPGHYPLVAKSEKTTYFTDSGPFTTFYSSPIPQNFIYRNNDAAHGEINIASNPSITPILTGPSGGIVLGVDDTKRALYIGDVDLYYAIVGTGGTNDNRLTNTTGVIDNNASRLTANTWAWIAKTVLER